MIYTELTKKALSICFDAHKDQRDKSGLPYVFHPFHVAEQMKDEFTTVVALLHDVVEDSEYTLDDLRTIFPQRIVDAIAVLTHDTQTTYMAYIDDVKQDAIATIVKIADLEHNADLSRLSTVTKKDVARSKKYKAAISYLKGGF